MSKKNVRLESLFILSEIISPSNDREKIKQEILSDSINWLSVVEIANTHFLTAALYYSLLDKDLLNFIDDEELLAYLEQIYTINLHRNQKIIEQSEEIAQILSKKGIKPIFLKGAASLLQNDYKDIGMRFLSDIDFCITENSLHEAINLLTSTGYITNETNKSIKPVWHHWWPMSHKKWDAVLEVHRYALGYPFSQYIHCDEENFDKNFKQMGSSVLSPTIRLIHAYIHSDLIDRNYDFKNIDLRQLYEINIIINNYGLQIDWLYIEKKFHSYKIFDKFNYKLYLIYKLFNTETPIMKENFTAKLHLRILYLNFKYYDSFLRKIFSTNREILHRLSYTDIRKRYNITSKKEYIYYLFRYLQKKNIFTLYSSIFKNYFSH